jgi:alpha-amylase
MLEWALPAKASATFSRVVHEAEAEHRDDVSRFLRGGFWRNFLVKYDEVNTMHKKMLRAHHKARSTAVVLGEPEAVALDELWKSQCNCPYWHGVFGGIYMTDVRTATFHHLIRSEQRSDLVLRGEAPWIDSDEVDFDCDTREELIVDSASASYYLDPARGGSLFEWDVRESAHNLVSVMTRREEAYHEKLRAATEPTADDANGGGAKTIHDVVRIKESGLERLLHYDWYRRACLIDHFLGSGTNLESFANCTYEELGDFVIEPYRVETRGDATNREITLTRDGHVRIGAELAAVTVKKALSFNATDPGFRAAYEVVNRDDKPRLLNFGVEFNLNLLGGGGNPAAYRRFGRDGSNERFDGPAQAEHADAVVVGNEYLGVSATIATSHPATAWWASIESVSSSEGGFERVHQGGVLLFSWRLNLNPGETWSVTLQATAGAH